VGYVFFQGVGINKNVVQINDTENIKELMETIVGVGLEGGRGVGKVPLQ
jgi:hypothetical protein